jgi:hypothetical protein
MGRVFATIARRGKDPMLWKPGVADDLPPRSLPKNVIFDLYSGEP